MPDFERPPLHQMTRELAATAMGRLPATLVVRGGTLVSVTSGEILPNMSVAGLMSPEPYEEVGSGRELSARRSYGPAAASTTPS